MIQIEEAYYQLNLIDIINELKSQLAIQGVYLFDKIKELPEDLMVSCPFHKNGQERKPSCGIRKSDGFLHCFSCGETCSLEQLISRCFNKNDFGQFGLKWLQQNFLGNIVENRQINIDVKRNKNKKIAINYITEEELDKYRYYHPYMFQRKLTKEIIDKFDIGYDKETNCITFPVKNENGNCLFIARRSVITKYFSYPKNVEKPVYGLYELPKNINEVIICESMINALTCYVYGRPALALNGTGTPYQYEQLKKLNCRKLILALDPDEAGYKGIIKLKKALNQYKIITELKIPVGKDINDLSIDEFKNLVEKF